MRTDKKWQIDLPLEIRTIRLLLTLLDEPQLSKTALELGISLGTASRELKTAREVLGDKLFIRSGGLMVPTRRMLDAAEGFAKTLADLSAICRPLAPFSPAASEEVIHIAAFDNAVMTLLLPAMARLRREAPGMRFQVRMLTDESLAEMRSGELDLSLFCDRSLQAGPSFHRQLLLISRHVIAVRKGHPLEKLAKKRPLAAEDLTPFPRSDIVVRFPSGGGYRGILDSSGHPAKCTVTMPHFMAAGFFLAQSDDILTVPMETARLYQKFLPITTLDDPVMGSWPWEPLMMWHERTQRSPVHQWVRAVIAQEAGRLPDINFGNVETQKSGEAACGSPRRAKKA